MRREEEETAKNEKRTKVGAKRVAGRGKNKKVRKTASRGAPTFLGKCFSVTPKRNNGRGPRRINGLGTGATFIRRKEEVESKGRKVLIHESTSAQLFLYATSEDKGKKQEKSRLVQEEINIRPPKDQAIEIRKRTET